LTRVATAETEERLLAVGRAGTAEHVEMIVRGWRRMDRKAEAQETTRRHRDRALHVYPDGDGMVVIRGRLEPEVGAVVMQALTAAREALYRRRQTKNVPAGTSSVPVPAGTSVVDGSPEAPTMEQQQADALALVAEAALHHGINPGTPGERYQVVVHIDAQVLADGDMPGQSVLEGGARVPAETSQRLACDASRVVMRGRCDTMPTAGSRRSAPVHGRSRRRSGARCSIAIAAVASPAAGYRSVRAITFDSGRMAGPRRCPISRCFVGGITVRSTKRDSRWNDSPMVSSASAGRTGGYCLKSRRRR
jgi:hypothetical protein